MEPPSTKIFQIVTVLIDISLMGLLRVSSFPLKVLSVPLDLDTLRAMEFLQHLHQICLKCSKMNPEDIDLLAGQCNVDVSICTTH